MTATVTAGSPASTQRAVAEYCLDQLTTVAGRMTALQPVAEQLAGALHPTAVRAPLPGQTVLVCPGCRQAVDSAELRWWPRPSGAGSHPRVGCVTCVVTGVEPTR